MRLIVKDRVLVLVADDDEEHTHVRALTEASSNHVYEVQVHAGAIVFTDLGEREDACREPINIGSRVADARHAVISNFAATPFELDGRHYASVEGFWQSLRPVDPLERKRIAALTGATAKRAGDQYPWNTFFDYEGATIGVGRPEHWQLMERACEAKFRANRGARAGLLSTGERPLTHRMRHDSRSIPGVVMAEIWMRVRTRLRAERL